MSLANAVVDHFTANLHACDYFESIDDASSAMETTSHDLILLNLNLLDCSEVTLLHNLRCKIVMIPIIVMTACDKIIDRIKGLNDGFDDYIIKQFSLDELNI